MLALTVAAVTAAWLRPAAAQGGEPAPPPAPVVSIAARDADVRAVLTDLFQQAKINDYSLANDVSGRVTISLKDKPFEEALTLIARVNVPALTWNKTGSFYEVKVRRVTPRGVSEDPPPVAAAAEPPSPSETGWIEKVSLMFSDPRAIVSALEALRPPGLTVAFAYMPTNALLVRFGPGGDLVTGVIGGDPEFLGGGSAGRGGAPGGRPGAGPGNAGGPGAGGPPANGPAGGSGGPAPGP